MVPVDRKRLFAAVVFVAAVVVLAIQLINPSPIVVELGDNGSETVQVGERYTERGVAVVGLSACLLGASGTYLLTGGPKPEGQERTARSVDADHHRTTDAPTATNGAGGAGAHANPGARTDDTHANGQGVHAADDNQQQDDTKPSEQLLEARKQEWEETAERLANKERDVYESLLDADGVLPQSDIVDQTDLSKASVSRALDGLEAKQLVERKRRGMGNVVILQ